MHFSSERILKVKKPAWKIYALFVGGELYFKIRGSSDLEYRYKRYKEILVSASNGNKANEETFNVFWQMVDKTIKMMNVEGGRKAILGIELMRVQIPPNHKDTLMIDRDLAELYGVE